MTPTVAVKTDDFFLLKIFRCFPRSIVAAITIVIEVIRVTACLLLIVGLVFFIRKFRWRVDGGDVPCSPLLGSLRRLT